MRRRCARLSSSVSPDGISTSRNPFSSSGSTKNASPACSRSHFDPSGSACASRNSAISSVVRFPYRPARKSAHLAMVATGRDPPAGRDGVPSPSADAVAQQRGRKRCLSGLVSSWHGDCYMRGMKTDMQNQVEQVVYGAE
jgi:hypothetical protein